MAGAIIGYFTNWVAIKMLFRPHTEIRLFGVRLPFTPGLIPKRRGVLAKKVGETVSIHLLTDETLIKSMCGEEVKKHVEGVIDSFFKEAKQSELTLGGIIAKSSAERVGIDAQISGNIEKITEWLVGAAESPFFTENIKPLLMGVIEQNLKGVMSLFVAPESVYANFQKNLCGYLREPANHGIIEEKILVLYDKISESVKIKDLSAKIDEERINTLKALVMSKYDDAVKSFFPAVFEALNLSGVMEDKINEFEMSEAEDIIISVVDRELKAITYLGGLLGFIIGLVPPVLQSLGIN